MINKIKLNYFSLSSKNAYATLHKRHKQIPNRKHLHYEHEFRKPASYHVFTNTVFSILPENDLVSQIIVVI